MWTKCEPILLLSSGHGRLLVDYYLSIIDKCRAHQAILTLYSHISDQDIISPHNINTT